MTEFKLPELGENIDQGDLVRLMVSPGAAVQEGQPVMELETDKAVIEVPSSVSGVVQEIRVKEGDKLKVGGGSSVRCFFLALPECNQMPHHHRKRKLFIWLQRRKDCLGIFGQGSLQFTQVVII